MKTSLAIVAAMPLVGSVMALPVDNTTARLLGSRQPLVRHPRSNATAGENSLVAPPVQVSDNGAADLMTLHSVLDTVDPDSIKHHVPKALPQSTSSDAMHYQPVLDYSTHSCYNVPAIDAQGNVAAGLESSYQTNLSGGCRKKKHLYNQNVYVRSRCNNGWCAYMYEHYFEKDVGLQHVAGVGSGHRHEWENAVVVVKNGEGFPRLVAASAHDGYIRRMPRMHVRRVRFQGAHVKLVYHKDGAGTHAFRFGKLSDENIKNDKHKWVRGALVDWNGFPTFELRDRMVRAFVNTGTEPKISDAHFAKYLEKAIGKRIPNFDPYMED
ncbi:hypothetical protein E4U60_004874 [Claviceps pazoutovae]|uniref:Uncharacterized protein n=1 Tax=Claviceps pazoutovae TaxID=1649127 RepID=A0A9P7SJ46_9HYPO|nr:hypothetical protein E4U60_004874 [Claviceps pazoutovae]